MTALIITKLGVEEVSDREFFTRIFGHPPRTKAEREAEWNAGVERYVELILSGVKCSSYGNPQVIEAKRRIAERGQLTPFEMKELPDGRHQVAA